MGFISKCMSCLDGYILDAGKKKCIFGDKRPDNQYTLDDSKICNYCPSKTCYRCNDTADRSICTECPQNTLITANKRECLKTCPMNEFEDPLNTSCEKCVDRCEQCSSLTTCKKCEPGLYFANSNSSCVDECPQQYFKNVTSFTCIECTELKGCKLCINADFCVECLPGYSLSANGKCYESNNCPYQMTSNGTNCVSCKVSNCNITPNSLGSLCTADNLEECYSCGANSNSSLAKYSSFILSLDQKQCLNNTCMNIETFIDSTFPTNLRCRKCDDRCSECKINSTNCFACTGSNSLISSNNTCVRNCPLGTTKIGSFNAYHCINCIDENCLVCDSSLSCLKCNVEDGYFINETNRHCTRCDPSSNYVLINSEICKPCFEWCQTCSGNGKFDCLKCWENKVLNEAGSCGPKINNPIKIKYATYYEKNFSIRVQFNQKLEKMNFLAAFTPELLGDDGAVIKHSGRYLLEGDTSFSYTIFFREKVQICAGKFRFTNNNPTMIKSLEETESYFYENFTVPSINNLLLGMTSTMNLVGEKTTIVIRAVSVAAAISALPTAVVLVKLFQMIDYLMLLNVNHPINFQLMVRDLSDNPLNSMPNYFKQLTDDSCRPMREVFVKNNMHCQFMGNIGPTLGILMIVLTLKFFLWLWALRTSRYSSLWSYQIPFNYLTSKVSTEFFISLLNMFQLDLYLAIFINLDSCKLTTKNSALNLVISICTFCMLLSVNILLFIARDKSEIALQNTKQAIKEEEEFEASIDQKNRFMYEDTRIIKRKKRIDAQFSFWSYFEFMASDKEKMSRYERYNLPFRMLRDPILTAFILFFSEIPILQVCSVTLIIGFYLSLEIIYRPEKSMVLQIIQIFNLSIYTTVNLFLLVLSSNKISVDAAYIYIGYPIIGLIGLLMTLNIAYSLINSIYSIYRGIRKALELIRQLCRKCRRSKKIHQKKKKTKQNEGESNKEPNPSSTFDDPELPITKKLQSNIAFKKPELNESQLPLNESSVSNNKVYKMEKDRAKGETKLRSRPRNQY